MVSSKLHFNHLLMGFLLAMSVSLTTTIFLLYTGERMATRHSPLIDAANEIKLNATQGHLWFEEILSGDSHEDIDRVWEYLEQADWYALAMLEGGTNSKGVFFPLTDTDMRLHIESVRAALHEFDQVAYQRYLNRQSSPPGSDIDQAFDRIFNDFMGKAEHVERLLKHLIDRDLKNFRKMALLLISLSISISMVIAYVLYRHEKQRLAHVSAIEQANVEIQKTHTELNYLAHFDSLTGLPNRTLFKDRLDQALAHAHRKSAHVVLLFIDLDKFKAVNDRLGHISGDQVLKHTAERLQKHVREDDSVSRLAGDEFTVILSDIDSMTGAMNAAKKVSRSILQELSDPFVFNGNTVFLTASIGIAIYPQDGKSGDELLINADHAMLEAKSNHKDEFLFHSPEINQRVQRQLQIENELRSAIEDGQLTVHYQPQWNVQSNKLAGIEALVRWNHPEEGLLQPNAFIPIAETNGLIEKVDIWVLESACRQYREWRTEGLNPGKLAINISASLFGRQDLIHIVTRNIAEYCILDGELELELTESALLENSEHTQILLQQLRSRGIHLAIDDFGTGYSSMAYLRQFPAKTLKIDRSFINEIHTDKAADAILHNMAQLATSMDMEVVAEGIETQQQEQFIRSLGCQFAQGYLLGMPMSSDELRTLMISQTDNNVSLLPPNGR
ncbi:MAG: EAL domain-containing protein [Candidatus Thiodiazotropha sp. (ex Myrtea spinifera)]|nr:EAL domain-containing protein [Candidatus Thiodiazotropha sp. (ex Myrtea spinifera)]